MRRLVIAAAAARHGRIAVSRPRVDVAGDG